jgi:hypothetical protein
MNREQTNKYLPDREAIRKWLSEFYLDFKAGFLPMFLYVTAIVIVIAGLNFMFDKEIVLTILFGGVGIYITAMLGGLKRLRKQDTIFESSWKLDTISEDDPNVSQR